MNFKKWVVWFFGFVLVFTLPIVSLNLIVDPYDVFSTRLLKYSVNKNERYEKIEYLKENKTRYNSFIFGSSRAGMIRPEVFEKYLPGSKFYNLSVSSGTIHDHLLHLRYLIANGYDLKNICLQIDIDNMGRYWISEDDYLRKPHPDVMKTSKILFKLSYLTILPFSTIKAKLSYNIKPETREHDHDIQNTGTWFYLRREREIQKDLVGYVKAEQSLHNPTHQVFHKHPYYRLIIDDYRDFVRLCRERKIKLIVFTTPHYYRDMDTFVKEDVVSFLNDLIEIHSIWFFSGYNSITKDNKNYYEITHYRPMLADLIADRIFNDQKDLVPEDFGLFLSKGNINEDIFYYGNDYVTSHS